MTTTRSLSDYYNSAFSAYKNRFSEAGELAVTQTTRAPGDKHIGHTFYKAQDRWLCLNEDEGKVWPDIDGKLHTGSKRGADAFESLVESSRDSSRKRIFKPKKNYVFLWFWFKGFGGPTKVLDEVDYSRATDMLAHYALLTDYRLSFAVRVQGLIQFLDWIGKTKLESGKSLIEGNWIHLQYFTDFMKKFTPEVLKSLGSSSEAFEALDDERKTLITGHINRFGKMNRTDLIRSWIKIVSICLLVVGSFAALVAVTSASIQPMAISLGLFSLALVGRLLSKESAEKELSRLKTQAKILLEVSSAFTESPKSA